MFQLLRCGARYGDTVNIITFRDQNILAHSNLIWSRRRRLFRSQLTIESTFAYMHNACMFE